ncbi:MAG: hypothetical protein H7Y42_10705, partial [Chitinophagaceae bacterium]|nr:hypothetical protein [Chitinophagaceae bacterium]
MKKFTLFLLLAGLQFSPFCQTLQTTLKIVNGKVRIVVKAVGGDILTEPSNYIFSIAIPVANSGATVAVTALEPDRLPTTLNASGTYSDATYKYFNLNYTGANNLPSMGYVTFAENIEYSLIELTFTGATVGRVSLISMPDGNLSEGGVWYNFIELGGNTHSDPPGLFYQSPDTGAPTQAVDYSTGTAIITTIQTILPVSFLN